ncbi:MAG: arabinan endo-1,5-alpha-L-arabinosidase [Ruminococcaceae bacterium]|nr:arabinan endo-1,5-alpha-L-arabinosidase [Oscillospiraceae bacterium]
MSGLSFEIRNPIDSGWYADPEARFYNGEYIIYATKSLPFDEQKNQVCWTSPDLTNWTRHDDIIDMSGFPWARRAVWAPTAVEKNGLYYYVFATNDIHSEAEKGGLEIAVSSDPTGPFRALLDRPLVNGFHNGAQPIDAHLFKDDDGTVYLLFGGWKHCNIAVMNDDMTGFVPFPSGEIFREITPADYVEGPCMFKKDGKYYFLWSAGGWTTGTYHVNAASAPTPFGPFDDHYEILSTGDSTIANGPGHNGYLHIPEEDLWLMVYHRHENGLTDGNARFMCIDLMEFDENGRIRPVNMTRSWKYENGRAIPG